MAPNHAFVFLLHSNMQELSQQQIDRIEQKVDAIGKKLDALINALGEEFQEQGNTLDGDLLALERDQGESLG